MENDWDISAEIGSGDPPQTIICPKDKAEMVLVPKGEFTMGITREELRHVFLRDGRVNKVFATELPARRLHLEAYYIDRHPVTNRQYNIFLKETRHRAPYFANHPVWRRSMQPVVFVGWDDARAYATWVGKSRQGNG